ncbi:alanyl-tRNA editing protein [Parachitinimonas caeni]|uniref:Alanyl-tRNA editing protein n=1 Tax=Parachitinimonas caeni TaxID=3031301 RepID=A0ABT7E029_9NEIS|nr:alanyl-tRNA editing protein [Parachitinimonas caeni]MDK2125609.1 alanyl-tRNA editing protein [Parachitinimonas caeni]
MTERIFWQDPYLTRLTAQVIAVDGADLVLDRTIFFAFSGGQESDTGRIAGLTVESARKQENGSIVYTLPMPHGLQTGQRVEVEIDWPRRYRLMRLHFAAELVLELICQRLPGVEKIGAHIAEDKARIDFAWHENVSALFPELSAAIAAIVAADHPIRTGFSDEATGRRYWEITGLARVPCGGTHVRSTAEIGPLSLKRRNVGKGKERIEVSLNHDIGLC